MEKLKQQMLDQEEVSSAVCVCLQEFASMLTCMCMQAGVNFVSLIAMFFLLSISSLYLHLHAAFISDPSFKELMVPLPILPSQEPREVA